MTLVTLVRVAPPTGEDLLTKLVVAISACSEPSTVLLTIKNISHFF
ncbi:hypothetical protein [Nostoc sp.]